MVSICDNRFCIPLDFEILETSLPLYQYGLGSHLTYELTFADYSDVIKSTDPDATFTISNISLEFDTIINASLASQIRTEYMKSSILYDKILRARIIPLNKSDTSFSVDINSPSKSLKGVLLIFTQERSATKFARDTKEFYSYVAIANDSSNLFPEPDLKFPSSKSNCTALNKWYIISVTWSNKEKNQSNCWSNGIKIITFTSGDTKGSDYSFIGDLGRLNDSYNTYLSGCIGEIIGFHRGLTDTSHIHIYLMKKWGI